MQDAERVTGALGSVDLREAALKEPEPLVLPVESHSTDVFEEDNAG
jgi:hypothetical protein